MNIFKYRELEDNNFDIIIILIIIVICIIILIIFRTHHTEIFDPAVFHPAMFGY